MPIPKIVGAQRDFSAGEVDEALKRADELTAMKAGARQMLNWRILNSKAAQNRPGRSAKFIGDNRTEQITMPNGNVFFISLGTGVEIVNQAGAPVFSSVNRADGTPFPWSPATVGGIVYAIIGLAIYIT